MNFSCIGNDHKSVGINIIYQLFQLHNFLFVYHTEDDRLLLTGIHPLATDSCRSAIQVFHNDSGNLIRLLRDDKCLFGKLQTFDQTVGYFCYQINRNDGIQARWIPNTYIPTITISPSINCMICAME